MQRPYKHFPKIIFKKHLPLYKKGINGIRFLKEEENMDTRRRYDEAIPAEECLHCGEDRPFLLKYCLTDGAIRCRDCLNETRDRIDLVVNSGAIRGKAPRSGKRARLIR